MNILQAKKYYVSNQSQIIEYAKFTYSLLRKALQKQLKIQLKKQTETTEYKAKFNQRCIFKIIFSCRS